MTGTHGLRKKHSKQLVIAEEHIPDREVLDGARGDEGHGNQRLKGSTRAPACRGARPRAPLAGRTGLAGIPYPGRFHTSSQFPARAPETAREGACAPLRIGKPLLARVVKRGMGFYELAAKLINFLEGRNRWQNRTPAVLKECIFLSLQKE